MSTQLILLFGVLIGLLILLIAGPWLRRRIAPVRRHPDFGNPAIQDVTEIFTNRIRAPGTRPILRGSELAQQYKGRDPAPRNATIELYSGELACIVGENGAGKSTLLRMLALDEAPKYGEVYIEEEPLWRAPARRRTDMRARGISFIHPPQDNFGLMPWSPVRNIAHWLIRLDGENARAAEVRARIALSQVNGPHDVLRQALWDQQIDFNKKNFSGGQLARIAIAGAIALNRPICLADESMATLDPESQIQVLELFRQMANSGISVTVVAHVGDEHLLQQHFDRILRVGSGRQQQAARP